MSAIRPDKPWPDPERITVATFEPMPGVPLTVRAAVTTQGKTMVELRDGERTLFMTYCRDKSEAVESARRLSEAVLRVGVLAVNSMPGPTSHPLDPESTSGIPVVRTIVAPTTPSTTKNGVHKGGRTRAGAKR